MSAEVKVGDTIYVVGGTLHIDSLVLQPTGYMHATGRFRRDSDRRSFVRTFGWRADMKGENVEKVTQ